MIARNAFRTPRL